MNYILKCDKLKLNVSLTINRPVVYIKIDDVLVFGTHSRVIWFNDCD